MSTSLAAHRPVSPKKFPQDGFDRINESVKVEKETLPFYEEGLFYPAAHRVLAALTLSLSCLRLASASSSSKSCSLYKEGVAVSAIQQTILALDFLYHEASVIHTDRKVIGDRVTHVPQMLMTASGPPHLCDFGHARICPNSELQTGLIMPTQYRVPEVLLDMQWDFAVDLWSVGILAWDLLEPKSLFQIYDYNHPEIFLPSPHGEDTRATTAGLLAEKPKVPEVLGRRGRLEGSGYPATAGNAGVSRHVAAGQEKGRISGLHPGDAAVGTREAHVHRACMESSVDLRVGAGVRGHLEYKQ
ncbi:hypothetical protein E4U60_002519 [Claviceps pazoutovae]|uniref:Protein kinase domain-containing protein n=1 Tax=Claviceps pazoutovae TaxID=1649127 RepID=A0A9P7MBU4_9HYPO|nr:hypothetical protein E4U60_002519 [Claviceps pazoutovae]